MKIGLLIIGILITIGSGLAFVISLMLPALTNNKINFKEASIFIVLSLLVLIFGLVITVAAGIWMLLSKKKAAKMTPAAG